MTAYPPPYSPGELVRQCAQARVPRQAQLAGALLRKAPQFVLNFVGRRLVRGLDKIAMSQSAMALAFESLVERVAESPSDQFIDADDVLYAMLAAQEARLRKTSTELLTYWQPLNVGFSQRRAAVRLAALRVGEASQAVAAAARNLRGTIQAHDANVSALQQARRVCRTRTSHAENRHTVHV